MYMQQLSVVGCCYCHQYSSAIPSSLTHCPKLLPLRLFVSIALPSANIEQHESSVCARRLQQQPKDMEEEEGEEGEGKQDKKRVARPVKEERG